MMAGNEPGSSTGNLASSNCRYFMLGCNYRPSSGLLHGRRSAAAVVSGLMYGSRACLGGWARAGGRPGGAEGSPMAVIGHLRRKQREDFRMANGNQENPGSVASGIVYRAEPSRAQRSNGWRFSSAGG